MDARQAEALGEHLGQRRATDDALLDEHFAEDAAGDFLFRQGAGELLVCDDALLNQNVADSKFILNWRHFIFPTDGANDWLQETPHRGIDIFKQLEMGFDLRQFEHLPDRFIDSAELEALAASAEFVGDIEQGFEAAAIDEGDGGKVHHHAAELSADERAEGLSEFRDLRLGERAVRLQKRDRAVLLLVELHG
jgi:hypothetical protein